MAAPTQLLQALPARWQYQSQPLQAVLARGQHVTQLGDIVLTDTCWFRVTAGCLHKAVVTLTEEGAWLVDTVGVCHCATVGVEVSCCVCLCTLIHIYNIHRQSITICTYSMSYCYGNGSHN